MNHLAVLAVFILVLAGCIETVPDKISSDDVKKLTEVSSFLSANPSANTIIEEYSQEEVISDPAFVQDTCGSNLEEKDYFFVSLESDAEIVYYWIDAVSGEIECEKREEKEIIIPVTNACSLNQDCDDNDSSTYDECKGTPKVCSHIEITSCYNGDGYCPAQCNYETDSDCGLKTCLASGGEICESFEKCGGGFAQATDTERCCFTDCESLPTCGNDSDCDDSDPSTKDDCTGSPKVCVYTELEATSVKKIYEKGDTFRVEGMGDYGGDNLEAEIMDIFEDSGDYFARIRLYFDDYLIDEKTAGEGSLVFRDDDGERVSATDIELLEFNEEGSDERVIEITNELDWTFYEGDSFTVFGDNEHLGEELVVEVEEIYSNSVLLNLLGSDGDLIDSLEVSEDEDFEFLDDGEPAVITSINVDDISSDSVDIELYTFSSFAEGESFPVIVSGAEGDAELTFVITGLSYNEGVSYCDFEVWDGEDILYIRKDVRSDEDLLDVFDKSEFQLTEEIDFEINEYLSEEYFGIFMWNGNYSVGETFTVLGMNEYEDENLTVKVTSIGDGNVLLALYDDTILIDSRTVSEGDAGLFFLDSSSEFASRTALEIVSVGAGAVRIEARAAYFRDDEFTAEGNLSGSGTEYRVYVDELWEGEAELDLRHGSSTIDSDDFGEDDDVYFYNSDDERIMENSVETGDILEEPVLEAMVKLTNYD